MQINRNVWPNNGVSGVVTRITQHKGNTYAHSVKGAYKLIMEFNYELLRQFGFFARTSCCPQNGFNGYLSCPPINNHRHCRRGAFVCLHKIVSAQRFVVAAFEQCSAHYFIMAHPVWSSSCMCNCNILHIMYLSINAT